MCIMCIMFYYNLYIPIVINQFFIINEGTCEGTYEGTNTKEPIRRNQYEGTNGSLELPPLPKVICIQL